MTPDSLCPECHGEPRLLYVSKATLTKECLDCRHRWHEERTACAVPLIRPGGWIYRNEPRACDRDDDE